MDLTHIILTWLRSESWIPSDAIERLESLITDAKINPPE
jgi:hypothetical protein